MKISTKYDINSKVFKISKRPSQKWIPCPSCGGSGKVTLLNGERSCPDCYGRKGSIEYGDDGWFADSTPITVGQIKACVQNIEKSGDFENYGTFKKGANTFSNEYMCYETGIGSGSIHYEGTLWHSLEEAEEECNRLNN